MMANAAYNPNRALNERLAMAGASKTVYALISPETETAKEFALGDRSFITPEATARRNIFMNKHREAWTGKQDAYHREFFDLWSEWSAPVVDLDRQAYPFFYPTSGASEPIRQLIYDAAVSGVLNFHVFKGEYEGYRAMVEAVNKTRALANERRNKNMPMLTLTEWDRGNVNLVTSHFAKPGIDDLFFISQPSAIDGNVWQGFNAFIAAMPMDSVVADVTYVGAVPQSAVKERFNLNADAIRAVVFSLSKPFGLYYDRIGGVFCREENDALFGNMWFKSLYALHVGCEVLRRHRVFDLPERYRSTQAEAVKEVAQALALNIKPADVYMLATGPVDMSRHISGDRPLVDYLLRAGNVRVCVTQNMAERIGTAGEKL